MASTTISIVINQKFQGPYADTEFEAFKKNNKADITPALNYGGIFPVIQEFEKITVNRMAL